MIFREDKCFLKKPKNCWWWVENIICSAAMKVAHIVFLLQIFSRHSAAELFETASVEKTRERHDSRCLDPRPSHIASADFWMVTKPHNFYIEGEKLFWPSLIVSAKHSFWHWMTWLFYTLWVSEFGNWIGSANGCFRKSNHFIIILFIK